MSIRWESLATDGFGRQPFTGEGALTVAMKHIEETPPTLHADVPPQYPRAGRDQPGEGSLDAL